MYSTCSFRTAAICVISSFALLAAPACARTPPPPSPSSAASAPAPYPERYLLVYTNGAIPGDAEAHARLAGASLVHRAERFGIAVVQLSAPSANPDLTQRRLAAQPGVQYVVRDRIVHADSIFLAPAAFQSPLPRLASSSAPGLRLHPFDPGSHLNPDAGPAPSSTPSAPPPAASAAFYNSPQGWAVRQVGGFGANTPGGPPQGPWNITTGSGVRIAILDSGVDATHPSLAPNLALNLSEIDPSALPTPCDNASPQDQTGHGTWTASLAAAASGPGNGDVIGVAPSASILNIKVLQRMPSGDGRSPATQCPSGEASGLLSWVLQGIEDAIANRADIISMSLGILADQNTGDGAGLKATFDRITYAASQSGAILIASAGNDAFDLSNPRFLELPAQARGVLAIVASTNPACAEDTLPQATCIPGPVTLSYYSNHGVPLNALAAPGGSYPVGPNTGVSGWVRGACSSGLPATTDGLPADQNHSYGCFNLGHVPYVQAIGTSASAPLAAGVAALLRAAHPDWPPDRIVALMRSSAVVSPGLPTPQISAASALAVASSNP